MSHWSGVLRRHKAVPILTVVLSAILGAAAVGQISHIAPGATHDPDYPPPYDNSKADLALKAFDVGHPQCALWTDWHKLCSRTGPNGSTYCRLDELHPAKPSTPFCAVDHGSPPAPNSLAEKLSRRRFSDLERSAIPRDLKDFDEKTRPLYKSNRPFSGSSIYQVEHPYCAVWIYDNGLGPALCAEDGRKGLPSCHNPKIRYRKTTNMSFYPACYEAVKGRACDPRTTIPPDNNGSEDYLGNIYSGGEIAMGFHSNAATPVVGYTCKREKTK